jgi:uncharacterized membrane protein (Fun14 family)
MEFDPTQLGVQAGGGAVVGGVIGFAAKKIVKIVAVLVGLEFAILAYLENQGIISVKWSELQSAAAFTTGDGQMPPVVANALSAAPLSGGFAAGAAVGFKKG